MAMGFEVEAPKKRNRFHWPVIFQALSVVVGIICIGLTVEAMLQDDRFNDKVLNERLPQLVETTIMNGTELIPESELKPLLIRNAPLKKAYCLLIGFATSITIVHLLIYLVLKKEVYRYSFTIKLNAFLAFLYALAALFLLITLLQNDNRYGEIFRLVRDRHVPFPVNGSDISLYVYRYCQVNTGTRDEDKVPPVPKQFQHKVSSGLACQHFAFKMSGVLLAFFNCLFFFAVMLTVRSNTEEIRKAIDMVKDLDVEPWMWTHPDGTKAFISEYIYQQERAKYILREIDVEPEKPIRDHHFRRLTTTQSKSSTTAATTPTEV